MKINKFPAYFSEDVLKRCEIPLQELQLGDVFVKEDRCYIKTDMRYDLNFYSIQCVNLENGRMCSFDPYENVYVMCYNFEFTGIKVLNA